MLSVPESHLLVPNRLPDGTVIMEAHGAAKRIYEAIRTYDPRYSLVRNTERQHLASGKVGCWEVWRRNEDGNQNRCCTLWQDEWPTVEQVLGALYESDIRRGVDPVAEVRDHNAKIEATKRAEFLDEMEDKADKLHWGFTKAFDAHMPAARPISTGR